MSSLKIKSLALSLAVGSAASLISACGVTGSDSSDTTLMTPTGYYEHAEAKVLPDPIKTAPGVALYKDNNFAIPAVSPTEVSEGLVGEKMDVRPPVVSQVSESGVDILNKGESAVVWFLPYNSFNVTNEETAWRYLNSSLSYLKLPIASRDDTQYVIRTAEFNYNDFGEPYDDISKDLEASSFSQTYEIQVGHAQQGQIGYFITLLSSKHNKSSFELTPVQKSSFTVGFGNTLIKSLSLQAKGADVIPDYVQVTLGRDNNSQEALVVSAPYNTTWNVMRGTLDQYGMSVEEYSISRSTFTIKVSEEDSDFYRNLGIEPFLLESGEYIVRLAVSGDNTLITFYDEDDKPLNANKVAALYAGFSKALAQQFALYKSEGSKYLDKFADED